MNAPLAILLVANAIPLLGVLGFGWSAGAILALYWLENVLLGVLTAAWMLVGTRAPVAKRIGMTLFFCVHFGIFCLVHGMFVLVIASGDAPSGFTRLPDQMLAQLGQSGIGIAALAVSQVVGFVQAQRAIGRSRPIEKVMAAPYARIVVLHLAILVGAGAVVAIGEPVVAVAVLVVVKTWIEFLQRRKGDVGVNAGARTSRGAG